jgi:hypothetical protein
MLRGCEKCKTRQGKVRQFVRLATMLVGESGLDVERGQGYEVILCMPEHIKRHTSVCVPDSLECCYCQPPSEQCLIND